MRGDLALNALDRVGERDGEGDGEGRFELFEGDFDAGFIEVGVSVDSGDARGRFGMTHRSRIVLLRRRVRAEAVQLSAQTCSYLIST